MTDMSETYPNPTDARLYVDTAAAYDWQLFDVTRFTRHNDLDFLTVTAAAIARDGPVQRVHDQHQYLLAPKPPEGRTDVDALSDYPIVAHPCLEVAQLRPGETKWRQTTDTPRFVFFTRLIIDHAAVLVGTPSLSDRSQVDEAWLEPQSAAEAFARSFHVMTPEEYAAEIGRSQR